MIFYLLLLIPLGVIFAQDFRSREIHILPPLFIFIICIYINFKSIELESLSIVYNMIFVLVNLIGLCFYFSLKHKKIINPIDTFVGLGDIVFFLAITPLFNKSDYILFFVFGLIFALILHIGLSFIKPSNTVPLAGYMSLFLIFNVLMKEIFKINIIT